MNVESTFPLRLIISLQRREDRRAALLDRMAAAGITADWLPAVDGNRLSAAHGFMNPGKRSCAISKRLALRAACRSGAPAVLIFEDDVVFHSEFAERTATLMLPPDWGLFYFGCIHREPPEHVSSGLVRVRRCFDNHAFAVRREHFYTVRRVIRGAGRKASGRLCSDVLLSTLHKKIPTYAAFPNLAWQAEVFSDLAARRYSNYRPDGSQKLWESALAKL